MKKWIFIFPLLLATPTGFAKDAKAMTVEQFDNQFWEICFETKLVDKNEAGYCANCEMTRNLPDLNFVYIDPDSKQCKGQRALFDSKFSNYAWMTSEEKRAAKRLEILTGNKTRSATIRIENFFAKAAAGGKELLGGLKAAVDTVFPAKQKQKTEKKIRDPNFREIY